MGSCSSTRKRPPQPKTETSTVGVQSAGYEQGKKETPGSEDQPKQQPPSSGTMDETNEKAITSPECTEQEEGKEGTLGPKGLLSSSLDTMDEAAEVVITSIRATDVALGLRRLPVGFFAVVHHDGLEWKTENKPLSVHYDVVEWTGPIPIPSDLLVIVRLEVYASFEFHPTLGIGEQLRELTISVEQLLDRSATDILFEFLPKDGDVVTPCSSIAITVERRKRGNNDSSSSRVSGSYWSNPVPRGELEYATYHGQMTLSRYREHGDEQDLRRSVQHFERALDICPLGHPCRAVAQSNLAMARFVLCQVEDTGDLLEVPLQLYRDVLVFRPVGHPDRPSTLIQMAAVLFAQFQRRGVPLEREEAEALLNEAKELGLTESHENRAASFVLQLYAGHREGPVQPNNQSAVEDLTSQWTEDLETLGYQLLLHFKQYGDLADLEQAITIFEELVRSTATWDDRHCEALMNLGLGLWHRFNHLGELSDIEDAISRQSDAINLTPHGHPDRSARLNNLGNSYIARFVCLGEPHDLEVALSMQRSAVDLTPDNDPDKPTCLNNLGATIITRFEHFGELSDLEDAISTLRNAVELTPHGNPAKPTYLSNLGGSLITHFQHRGQLSDLEDAICLFRDAVQLTPHDHPKRPAFLGNLGTSFNVRFEFLKELSDLEDAISVLRDAAYLTPPGHPDKMIWLSNLGGSFKIRYEHLRQLSDLENAISAFKAAVDLTPDGHPYKPMRFNNLGISFLARFQNLGQLGDIESAISMLRDAVMLTHDHTDDHRYLNNLGTSLISRFEHSGQLSDLEDAISTFKKAVDLTPLGHPHRPTVLSNLADCLRTRFQHCGELGNLEQAMYIYSSAASAPIGFTYHRFVASKSWISCARQLCHHSLLHAYSVALALLPQLAWIGLSLSHRYDELAQGADVVWEAAAAALDSGLPETAVEWLEQGRLIVWGELFQLRSSFEELSSAYPDHSRRLHELSTALDHASAAREKTLSTLLDHSEGTAHRATLSPHQEADRHRALAIERDKLLQEIRQLPGFENFLLRKQFSNLRASAHSGPVVILNTAKTRCDALIVLANVNHPIHVPLPNFTFRQSAGLRTHLKHLVRHAREGKVARDEITWESFLPPLWKNVVKPVLDGLAFSIPGNLSRIFWCPTGPLAFLPIHAAGLYDRQHSEPGHKVFDFVVSSYVPSLSILLGLSNPKAASTNGDLRLVAVRQPSSDGQTPLPGVRIELERIKDVIRKFPSVRAALLEPSVGTVEEVLAMMRDADWVHFACHGIQDGTESGLCLADQRRLKLRDIIALSRPRGGLAFLSACQTATGEEELSDEAIHMAAGMLFAGYGGVVATMWSISDRLAPDVARDVYVQLFRAGTRPDYREAAWALHDAIGSLRDRDASFDEWVPFIHVGL